MNKRQTKLPFLNLGCGKTFDERWVNIYFVSASPHVIPCDLRKGIPLANQSVEVVYQSHILEHFKKDGAAALINECSRVLKPGGVIRIVVPDLEMIVRNYLLYLEKCLANDKQAPPRYDWMLLELYDQVVRRKTGGEMLDYLANAEYSDDTFVLERVGNEGGATHKAN